MKYMAIITIPKKITKGEDLVVLPREEYEELLELRKIHEFQPTPAQKKVLIKARENRKKGNFLTFNELKNKLGFRD